MNKRTITIVSAVGLVLLIVGWVLGIGGFIAGWAESDSGQNSDPGSLTLLIGILLFLVGSIVGFIGWIMTLIKTAQIGRWGWFVTVFLLSVLGALIYGAPARPSAPRDNPARYSPRVV